SLAVQLMEGRLDASFTQPPTTGWPATGGAARRAASPPSVRVSARLYRPPTKADRRYGLLLLPEKQSMPFPSESPLAMGTLQSFVDEAVSANPTSGWNK